MKKTILLLFLTFFSLRCGYHLSGTGKAINANSETISIPFFLNDTQNAEAIEFVTSSIRETFIHRTGLKLEEMAADADLLLDGKITLFEINSPKGLQTHSHVPYEIRIVVDIRLIDQNKHEILFERKDLPFTEIMELKSENYPLNEIESRAEISRQFSNYVVNTILENI